MSSKEVKTSGNLDEIFNRWSVNKDSLASNDNNFWINENFLRPYNERVNKLLLSNSIPLKAIPKSIQIAIDEWKIGIENRLLRHNSDRYFAFRWATNNDSYIEKSAA
jgi:hypothetical protein